MLAFAATGALGVTAVSYRQWEKKTNLAKVEGALQKKRKSVSKEGKNHDFGDIVITRIVSCHAAHGMDVPYILWLTFLFFQFSLPSLNPS